MSDIDERLAAMEARLAALEDQVQIYQLMSAYGPLVDSGAADDVAELWTKDGVYDWGGGPAPDPTVELRQGAAGAAFGQPAIAAMVRGDYHQQIIGGGAGHVIGLPHVAVDGDSAVAISYSRLYRRDGDGFKVWRVAANRWELVRTSSGWRVLRRTNRVLDGSAEARALLRSGFPEPMVAGSGTEGTEC